MNKTVSDQRFANLKFRGLSDTYHGKVRDMYETADGYLFAVASDRVSAFDHILPVPIPNKGIILNKMTQYFFERLRDTVPHWFISSPHPRILFGYRCKRIDIEVIVRGYIAGSLWRAYKEGKRELWGYHLPDGLRENEKLPFLMITPTTKAELGHDEDITEEHLIERKLCTEAQWKKIKEYALELFSIGTEVAAEQGLILVDTKYEFGIDTEGTIRLIDEVHTPDSSRYFYADSYEERFKRGLAQRQLSKEFIREWLMEHGFQGKAGQAMPDIPEDMIYAFRNRYYELFAAMTGIAPEEVIEDKFADNDAVMQDIMEHTLRFAREAKVGIIMGSDSDLSVMQKAADILDDLCIGYELTVVSAHRTPDRLASYALSARKRGLQVIIAGAGGAAHLPGMAAAYTTLPVIGVPVKSSNSIDGWDSVLSILQMPSGVPVATVALDGAANAGILAAQIIGSADDSVADRLASYKQSLQQKVFGAVEKMKRTYQCTLQ